MLSRIYFKKKQISKIIKVPLLGDVLLEKSKRAKRLCLTVKSDSTIRLAVPLQVTFKDSEHFLFSKISWIKKQLNKISKNKEGMIYLSPIDVKYARLPLEKRIVYLAGQHNFKFKKLFIKNQKTRWGSCSSKNNINLNAKLLHLPDKLVDYVIMHELVHTQVKNHSKEFWLMLTSYFPDTKECDRELKKYKL
tara:strand:+ start:60 stop:635 length:576 start_codon:yes stop_codon:yes gene_type:complete